MGIDRGLVFCQAQALTNGTTVLTDTIPLTTARKIFQGEPLCCFIQVSVAADAGNGDETYQFEAHTDDNAAMSSSAQLILRAISRTILLANTIHSVPVPMEAILETFLGMKAVLGGTTASITISAWLGRQADAEQLTQYQDSIVIS